MTVWRDVYILILTPNVNRKAHKVVVASQSPVLEGMIEQLQDTAVLHLTTYDHVAVVLMSAFSNPPNVYLEELALTH